MPTETDQSAPPVVPPIIAISEQIREAWSQVVAITSHRPVNPTLAVVALDRVTDLLGQRMALVAAELSTPPDGLSVYLADPVKAWALNRATNADGADRRKAADLADWWGRQPRRRRRSGR